MQLKENWSAEGMWIHGQRRCADQNTILEIKITNKILTISVTFHFLALFLLLRLCLPLTRYPALIQVTHVDCPCFEQSGQDTFSWTGTQLCSFSLSLLTSFELEALFLLCLPTNTARERHAIHSQKTRTGHFPKLYSFFLKWAIPTLHLRDFHRSFFHKEKLLQGLQTRQNLLWRRTSPLARRQLQ